MSIPGSNLLKSALRIIASTSVQYYQNTGRTTAANGTFIPSFASPITLVGSLQPVSRDKYVQFDLDLSREYMNFYVQRDLLDLERGVSGDVIAFNGRKLQCEAATPWFQIDGWIAILCVDIGPVT